MVKVEGIDELNMPITQEAWSKAIRSQKKPGPRPTACPWCSSTSCTHCRCTGSGLCDHGEHQCERDRYKRRLVCNPCEKHKLKARLQMNNNGSFSSSSLMLSQSTDEINYELSNLTKNIYIPRCSISGGEDYYKPRGSSFSSNSIINNDGGKNMKLNKCGRPRARSMSNVSTYSYRSAEGGITDGITALLACAGDFLFYYFRTLFKI